MFSIAVLSSRGSPFGGMQAEGFATGWVAWTAASKPSRRVSNNNRSMDGDGPALSQANSTMSPPRSRTDQETEGYLRPA
jgi:hypothetical protein